MSTNMDRWVGKVAVVTGASAGIGASIAEELVKAGVLVVGLARRSERLEALAASLKQAKGKFYAKQCDLRKEEDILSAFEWVNTELGGVDILVSNAAVSKHNRILDDAMESFRNILDVNILATLTCVQKAIESMKRRDVPGYIVTINSVLGHQFPGVNFRRSLYPSSKHALRTLTETVRKELVAEGNEKIKISGISPGLVKTEMPITGGSSEKIFETFPHLLAHNIAEAVMYVLGTPDKVHVTELTIRHVGEDF